MIRLDNNTLTDKNTDASSAPPHERCVSSRALLGPQGRVLIEHDGQFYLLRQTNAGKLILTK
ncbi:hemin uptake protein HemP [Pluralibacter sp.]|uniref:hemin uptake protein HemP n=1 Tax=Pluralibacter sp. TaxID=1920032 RepID=UPI0025FDB4F3|nr:hemin uptake protein HemP [Pluralibacter sp.]MBV8043714.1 hemin uptake protein HemP [Pluralibacter sp.]